MPKSQTGSWGNYDDYHMISSMFFYYIDSFGIGFTVASTGVFPLTVLILTFSFWGCPNRCRKSCVLLHNSQKTPNKKQAYWFDFERLRLAKVPVGSRVVVTSSSKCCLVKGMPTRIVLGFRLSKCYHLLYQDA